MNKANVDDMLIEMITPKVKEIEERFSKGEGLAQDDINLYCSNPNTTTSTTST